MTFPGAVIAGVLGMAAGWILVAAAVIGLGSVLGVTDRDGGLAMMAFFFAGPLGGVIGLVAGVWLALSRSGTRGIAALTAHVIASLAAVGALSAAVAGVFWMIRPLVAPNALPPSLMFEIRLPVDAVVPPLVNRAEAYARRSQVELHTSENTMSAEIHEVRTAAGRPVVAGRVEMHYRTRERLLVLKQPSGDVVFQINLGATPRHSPEFGPWQPPVTMPGQTPASGEHSYEFRYRAALEEEY